MKSLFPPVITPPESSPVMMPQQRNTSSTYRSRSGGIGSSGDHRGYYAEDEVSN